MIFWQNILLDTNLLYDRNNTCRLYCQTKNDEYTYNQALIKLHISVEYRGRISKFHIESILGNLLSLSRSNNIKEIIRRKASTNSTHLENKGCSKSFKNKTL